ncbi:MAG: EAL domain-containing protein [Leptospira sp.]|nr:EAL domain-containing protein [Leptospira sp.]
MNYRDENLPKAVSMEQLLNSLPGIFYLIDSEGRFHSWNEQFIKVSGYSASEMLNLNPLDLFHGNDKDLIAENIQKVFETGSSSVEAKFFTKDGLLIPYFFSGTKIIIDGTPYLSGMGHDITEKISQEKNLQRLNRIYEVMSAINSLIVKAPPKLELFSETVRISVKFGNFDMAVIDIYHEKEDTIEYIVGDSKNKEDLKSFEAVRICNVLSGKGLISQSVRDKKTHYSNELTQACPTQSPRREIAMQLGFRSMIVLPIIVDCKVVVVLSLYSKEANFFDETELKLLNELSADISFALNHIQTSMEALFLSKFNPVTALPNRNNFLENVETILRRLKKSLNRGNMIVFDFEKFRNINSSIGRRVGDMILQKVKDRFYEYSDSNFYMGHLERDHFAIFLEGDYSSSELLQILHSFNDLIFSEPYLIEDQSFHISGRFGISQYPTDAQDADSLLKYAEDARNRSKITKELFTFFSTDMNLKFVAEQNLENQIRQAFANQEFEFYYQPKFDSFKKNLTGSEALIRCMHRDVFIGPDIFIPIMEDMGLIHEVGRFAIMDALQKYKKWQSMDLEPPRIAVNISATQFGHKDFLELVESILSQHDESLRNHGLDIEITENSILNNIERTIQTIDSLRKLGIRLSIDDFGTGFSSLKYITKLPLDTLKIDKSFIHTMLMNPADMTVVSTIITLAHQLGISVVAEGVETEEQASLLRGLKCNEIQGYLYGKPMSEGDYIDFLKLQKEKKKSVVI